MVLLLRKLYLYFTKDPEGVHYFPGRDVKLFPVGGGGGVQMLISLETHVRTCYFPGGCPDPLSPSGSAHGQCHHNGTIFITVRLLTIIVRHWFVRINDRWCTGTAHVRHLRETQLLKVVVFAIQLFFSQISTTSTQWVEQYRWLANTK